MPRTAPPASTVQRVELEIEIAAPAATVWETLTRDATLWWPKDFYTGPAKAFHIEPRIGGRVYEDWGDGAGVIWYHVFAVNPGRSLDLQGHLGVKFGAAVSILHLELEERKRRTVLQVSEATIGTAGDSAEKSTGWRTIFAGLKKQAEAGR